MIPGSLALITIFGFVAVPDTQPATQPVMNARCPVMPDQAADRRFRINIRGVDVYVCCPKCRRLMERDPAAYAHNVPALAGLFPSPPRHHDASPPTSSNHGARTLTDSLGRLHPMLVHFPIALLVVAGLARRWRAGSV